MLVRPLRTPRVRAFARESIPPSRRGFHLANVYRGHVDRRRRRNRGPRTYVRSLLSRARGPARLYEYFTSVYLNVPHISTSYYPYISLAINVLARSLLETSRESN